MSNDKRNVVIFAILAAVFAGGSVPIAASSSVNHAVIAAPLAVAAIFLFLAGYYSGLSRQ